MAGWGSLPFGPDRWILREELLLVSVFEAVMLVCFGVSWPISIAKTLRTKVVVGKSPLFMAIVSFGYVNGVVHKALYSLDWIIVLYAMNTVLVATDLVLYFIYAPKRQPVAEGMLTGRVSRACPSLVKPGRIGTLPSKAKRFESSCGRIGHDGSVPR